MTEPIRVLIADDHPVFRDGLATLLAPHPDIEVVGRAADGAEAVALAGELRPDVIVMDIQMPEVNGIEATRRVLAADPSVGVLVFTMGEDDSTLLSAMRAGARGYLVKGASQEEVTRAITSVHAGGVVFGSSLASRIGELLSPAPGRGASEFPMLTEREREVLDLIAAGRSNAQIAATLFLAPKTVRNNVSAILSKLQATDRAEVIIRARDAGLGQGG
jgi:DNA-binding NarL/FixJ family response regulator